MMIRLLRLCLRGEGRRGKGSLFPNYLLYIITTANCVVIRAGPGFQPVCFCFFWLFGNIIGLFGWLVIGTWRVFVLAFL